MVSNNISGGRALLWGSRVVKEKGWKFLYVEGDLKIVIGLLKVGDYRNWLLHTIISKARVHASSFDKIAFNHIRRTDNIVADWAAGKRVGLKVKEGVGY
ncbi:hypothetical protein SUGI_0905180 [Cryptomeria japonica]|nr:hypothetical protein SUGI_0905180 [Cryptomeria japonica]